MSTLTLYMDKKAPEFLYQGLLIKLVKTVQFC